MTRRSPLAAISAVILMVAMAGPAFAASGDGTYGGTTSNGGGAKNVQYKASYTDYFFGPVRCAGVHQAGKNFASQDSFTCTSTTGQPLTNVTPGEALTLSTFGGWVSDYYNRLGQSVSAVSFNGTVSADGLSETAVANY